MWTLESCRWSSWPPKSFWRPSNRPTPSTESTNSQESKQPYHISKWHDLFTISSFVYYYLLLRELRIGTTMMAVRCYLLFVVVVVAALMHHVSGTTLVRSSNGGRIKGATTANDSERHLQVDTERKTKKHAGNILLTLDQVVSSIDITYAAF